MVEFVAILNNNQRFLLPPVQDAEIPYGNLTELCIKNPAYIPGVFKLYKLAKEHNLDMSIFNRNIARMNSSFNPRGLNMYTDAINLDKNKKRIASMYHLLDLASSRRYAFGNGEYMCVGLSEVSNSYVGKTYEVNLSYGISFNQLVMDYIIKTEFEQNVFMLGEVLIILRDLDELLDMKLINYFMKADGESIINIFREYGATNLEIDSFFYAFDCLAPATAIKALNTKKTQDPEAVDTTHVKVIKEFINKMKVGKANQNKKMKVRSRL